MEIRKVGVLGCGLMGCRIAQISAAAGFEKLGVHPPVLMSLAKKQEIIYVYGHLEPLKMARRNPALRLLQSVRDEAHRFVQHYHHILRRKVTLETPVQPQNRKKSDK